MWDPPPETPIHQVQVRTQEYALSQVLQMIKTTLLVWPDTRNSKVPVASLGRNYSVLPHFLWVFLLFSEGTLCYFNLAPF